MVSSQLHASDDRSRSYAHNAWTAKFVWRLTNYNPPTRWRKAMRSLTAGGAIHPQPTRIAKIKIAGILITNSQDLPLQRKRNRGGRLDGCATEIDLSGTNAPRKCAEKETDSQLRYVTKARGTASNSFYCLLCTLYFYSASLLLPRTHRHAILA
jgi:hypothetical protein